MFLSWMLVFFQFSLILLITWPVAGSAGWVPGLLITAFGILLGLWCLFHNKPGAFNIQPEVHRRAMLVTTGPYHWIRHPMYTSVFLFSLGMVLFHQTLFGLVCLVLMAPVLWLKAIREELFMGHKFPEYDRQMSSIKRFVPFIL